ncbi:O-acetyl-ADP-ribose deacetylase [Jejuia spongiicola]|uniref:O-acetyl-ADP-ribose deacetylase n=1 Tax=Jejuia spongiicola TaxID=2942207 RepID=A0ABT0Q9Q9_9FLAO|nr:MULTISPECIES: O-acetyl-ADP-ribose deacetylase [Flavobacteriaceae]MCL6293714.1 O-acetyl-ADP-ribose deacetylase [Jejuia spongiicola]PIA78732.1 O-acetyl-ADP-ribose deacetylase [Gaetbulibacter sp. 4G1]
MEIRVIQSDITTIKADAIVNAANSSLLGGSGVDGAIHRKGGSEILKACKDIRNKQGKCNVGEAVITTAGNLDARYVIHTVGPVWNQGGKEKEILLSECYNNTMLLAMENNVKTVAFPNISTGIYKFPKDLAAQIAINTIKEYKAQEIVEEVIFVCFDKENYELYYKILNNKHN